MTKRDPDAALVRAHLLKTVDNQLRDGDPPETRETLQRLIAEGHTRAEARRLIACVVASEVYNVLKYNRPFNEAGYVAALRRLPELTDEEG